MSGKLLAVKVTGLVVVMVEVEVEVEVDAREEVVGGTREEAEGVVVEEELEEEKIVEQ